MEKQPKNCGFGLFLKSGLSIGALLGILYSGIAFAGTSDSGIGGVAQNITGQFEAIGKLILAVAFLSGIGFIMAAIFKFKQHKDNPNQITLGVPLSLLVIGVVLVFLPSLVGPAGSSIFTNAKAGGFKGGGVSIIPGSSS